MKFIQYIDKNSEDETFAHTSHLNLKGDKIIGAVSQKAMVILRLGVFFFPALTLAFTVPKPIIINLNISSLNPLPINITSFSAPFPAAAAVAASLNASAIDSRYWHCFTPSRRAHPATFADCHHIAEAVDLMDPTGKEDFLFSPRAVADVKLPFYMHWGSCVMDLRGMERDSWDVFPVSLLADAIDHLART